MQEKTSRKVSMQPLYQQIFDDIKRMIDQGEYEYGVRIAGESELMQSYGVSRITVRRAIMELSQRGYLSKKQGLGTFVEQKRLTRLFSGIEGFSVSCAKADMIPSYQLLQMGYAQGKDSERAFVSMKEGEQFIFTSRILSASNIPFMQENCYFPCTERFQFLFSTSLEQPLFPLLMEHKVFPVSTSQRVLKIRLASKELAKIMRLPVGEPMFYKVAYLIDGEGKPLYIEKSYMVGSRYEFYI